MKNANEQRLAELKEALNSRPRVSLGNLPTPLERCSGLTRALGGPEIWMKRDDLTRLATGGNKARMFEYALGPRLSKKTGLNRGVEERRVLCRTIWS